MGVKNIKNRNASKMIPDNIRILKKAEVTGKIIKNWRNELFDWIFPRRCPVCDDIVAPKGELCCLPCRECLRYIQEPRCKKCGKGLEHEEQEYCYDCTVRKHFFDCGYALYEYKSMAESIYRFKYAGRAEYAQFYAGEIVERLGRVMRSWNADALIPVPLYKKKQNRRGYNQAEVLAQAIGEQLKLPVYANYIQRVRETVPQKELDEKERQNNLKRAFKIPRNDVKLKTIIVIDDIYTTGSTIDAIAKIFQESDAERIYFIALSIGKGF